MPSPLLLDLPPTDCVRRARPLLGTVVAIEATGAAALHATDVAFADIERLHALMSFHEVASELSRLNRDASRCPTQVSPATFAVLTFAAEMYRVSGSVFDITIAPHLVRSGHLPRPPGAPDTDPHATAADIELDAVTTTVRFHRPLWIDLGGIAKGYAVDCAVEKLLGLGIETGCVNAGGDLRLFGAEAQTVLLRSDHAINAPALALHAASLASSTHDPSDPVHYSANQPATCASFAAIVADTCMTADALTKTALALGPAVAPILEAYNATGYVEDAAGWHMLGRAP